MKADNVYAPECQWRSTNKVPSMIETKGYLLGVWQLVDHGSNSNTSGTGGEG